jgi:hydrogenase maturation protein HypF
LLVRADRDEAVNRLRQRKTRPTKPLAVMVASLDAARRLARIGPVEASLLSSPANPIVLLKVLSGSSLASGIAPRLDRVGIMLPTTPLHALLLAEIDFPIVATSGNHSEEPIVIEENEAHEVLGGIADVFLVHDRPILRRDWPAASSHCRCRPWSTGPKPTEW